MRLLAIMAMLAAASPLAAQTTNTQCRWIGSIWSCDSRETGVKVAPPIDQGAALQAGSSMVPKYESRRKADDPPRDEFFDSILSSCGTNLDRLPDDRRAITSAMCYAYAKGKSSR